MTISNQTRQTELACRVALAGSGATRRKGLLGRDGLSQGEGLWIVPCEAVHTFGMRFDLDLIFVDRKLQVRKVKSNVRPWRVAACMSAHSVIELAAGTILQTQTQAGDLLAATNCPEIEKPMSMGAPPLTRKLSLRALGEASVAVICSLTFAFTALFLLVTLINGKTAGTRDFAVYWATGRQFAHHANPYDTADLMRIERQAGLEAGRGAMYMRNPPWMLPLTLPLAFVSLRTASTIWTLLLLGCLGASMRMLWNLHGRPRNHLHLLGFAFAPALVCILFGQTSILALLGLVLFLRLHAMRPLLAGASLWLCALKPHLLLPFAVVLLAWIAVSRSYRILAGFLAALAVSCIVVSLIDPLAWVQYARMMRASGVAGGEFIPCLSLLLRLWLYPKALWLQYLPAAIGCICMFRYYRARRFKWSWLEHGNLVVLVSLVVAPYAWPFDQVLAIPALLFSLYRTHSRGLVAALALANSLIELAVFGQVRIPSAMYFWTLWAAPAWLLWCLLADRFSSSTFFPSQEESFAY